MQRTEPVGTSMLVMTRARQVAYLCSWQCTSISVSSPHRFKNACCLFNCVSSTVYHSPYCYTVLNGFWTWTFICLRFFAFFPHTSFYAFSHLRIPFFCFLLFLLFIFITVFLYPIFPRTCFIALNFILLRASFDATISLPVSVFVSILAQRQASYNLYTS